MSLAPVGPIGMDDRPPSVIGRLADRAARHKAKNLLRQLKIESLALKLLSKHGFIDELWTDFHDQQDTRAKATFGKCLAEIARLGKREPAAASAIGQQTNIQINIIQAAPVPAAEVDAEFGLVMPKAAGESQ